MNYSKIEKDVAEFVRNSYTTSETQYPYHNLAHTVDVVQHVGEIGAYYLLSAPEQFIVRIAAWFHDIGHLDGDMPGHEARGVAIMQDCLGPLGVSNTLMAGITDCIMATAYPSNPRGLYEQILCDADTFHFGTSRFRDTDMLVRKEVELRTGKLYPDWHLKSLKLLVEHQFFTVYCRQMLDAGKQDNIKWLRSLVSPIG
jgi:predicted metal-dependent HD superfamily phosphohydrolase